jgi:hypothetical protein
MRHVLPRTFNHEHKEPAWSLQQKGSELRRDLDKWTLVQVQFLWDDEAPTMTFADGKVVSRAEMIAQSRADDIVALLKTQAVVNEELTPIRQESLAVTRRQE